MGVQEKRKSHLMLPELQNLLLSAIAIILSLFITAAIMLASGYHPFEAFRALLDGAFGSRNSIATTLGKTIPLVFVGLACAYSNKGGLFNIGCEGQLYIGGLAATVTALQMQGMPRVLVLTASFAAGMLAGGLVGGVNGFLKAKLNINEVLVAIMLNYILKFFASYCVHGPLQDPESSVAQTTAIGENYMLTKLVPKSQLTTAVLIGILLAVLLYLFFNKTRAGFNIRAVGENGTAAQASGIDTDSDYDDGCEWCISCTDRYYGSIWKDREICGWFFTRLWLYRYCSGSVRKKSSVRRAIERTFVWNHGIRGNENELHSRSIYQYD